MMKDELIAWRQLFQNMILAELTVRNTVLLETIQAHTSGHSGATIQDGILRTVSLLEQIAKRNDKLFQDHVEAQMLADEMQETVKTLQTLAKNLA
jgi:hypothetical protein